MPNLKSAKKKLRKDIKRTKENEVYKKKVQKTIKDIVKSGSKATKRTLDKAYSIIDKAAKKKVIHKNRAARLKARVSKLLAKR